MGAVMEDFGTLIIEPLTVASVTEAQNTAAESMAGRTPMSVALGRGVEGYHSLWDPIVARCAGKGLSFVARSSKSGRMLGMVVNEDFANAEVMTETNYKGSVADEVDPVLYISI